MFIKNYFDGKSLEKSKLTIRPAEAWEDIEKDCKVWINEIRIPQGVRTVLEIGCGIGRLLKPLSEQYSCFGIDASTNMIKYSEQYTPKSFTILCDGTGIIPFHSDMFDFIFSVIVFQHIPDINVVKKFIAEAYRVLKPNGTFRFQVLKDVGAGNVNTVLKNYHNHGDLMACMLLKGFHDLDKRDSLKHWVMISGSKKE
jgi:SAM-dependent methyltransferase